MSPATAVTISLIVIAPSVLSNDTLLPAVTAALVSTSSWAVTSMSPATAVTVSLIVIAPSVLRNDTVLPACTVP